MQTVTQLSNALPTIMTTIANVAPAVLALLGIAAVGTAIDEGILNLPNGVNVNKQTIQKTIEIIIASTAGITAEMTMDRIYQIAGVHGNSFNKSSTYLNYLEAMVVLTLYKYSIFNAHKYFLNLPEIGTEITQALNFLEILKPASFGVYTKEMKEAAQLAITVGAPYLNNLVKPEIHISKKDDAQSYWHFHDKDRIIHIWFGEKLVK